MPHVYALYIAPERGAEPQRVATAKALKGRGLEGDRYAEATGSFSRWPGPHRDLSIITLEALERAQAEFGVDLLGGQHRRNVVVAGIAPEALAALKGQTFQLGPVTLQGLRLCAPCQYLVRTTGHAQAFDALVGRGGLRAAILGGGTLKEGDRLAAAEGSESTPPA